MTKRKIIKLCSVALIFVLSIAAFCIPSFADDSSTEYVIEAGSYTFKSTVTKPSSAFHQSFQFTSSNSSFIGISFDYSSNIGSWYLALMQSDGPILSYFDSSGVASVLYRNITLESDQVVSLDFYVWFYSNIDGKTLISGEFSFGNSGEYIKRGDISGNFDVEFSVPGYNYEFTRLCFTNYGGNKYVILANNSQTALIIAECPLDSSNYVVCIDSFKLVFSEYTVVDSALYDWIYLYSGEEPPVVDPPVVEPPVVDPPVVDPPDGDYVLSGKYCFYKTIDLPFGAVEFGYLLESGGIYEVNFESNGKSYYGFAPLFYGPSVDSLSSSAVYSSSTGWYDLSFRFVDFGAGSVVSEGLYNFVVDNAFVYSDDIDLDHFDKAYDLGYSSGFDKGKNDGYDVGYGIGYDSGFLTGGNSDGGGFFSSIFGGVFSALDSFVIFGDISILDVFQTLLALFILAWILKLISGG